MWVRAQECFLARASVLSGAKGVKHNLFCQDTCSSCRTAASSGTTVWGGCGVPATAEHQEILHVRAVCTRGKWGTGTLSLAFMGVFRPLSLVSLGLGDRIKTTHDFYFLHTVLTSNVEVLTSTSTFLDTSRVQKRYHFLGENPAQSFFSCHVHLVA